ncbi:MAG TPA: hypothetical protein VF942_12045 [Acidimicrobiales bacterium]
MPEAMGFFTDTTVCIGCKACEVACKEWNQLPAAHGGLGELSGDSYDNTRRLRPFTIDGKVIHHVGMPWHWGYEGLVTGDVVNELTSLVADPNVTIHEGKAFVCNVEKA